jgi:hypothetical protein
MAEFTHSIRPLRHLRDGIQLSEAITGDGAAILRHACGLGFEDIRLQAHRLSIRERQSAGSSRRRTRTSNGDLGDKPVI